MQDLASSAPTKPGLGITEMAKTFHELMLKLGYDTYVAQGTCNLPEAPLFCRLLATLRLSLE